MREAFTTKNCRHEWLVGLVRFNSFSYHLGCQLLLFDEYGSLDIRQ